MKIKFGDPVEVIWEDACGSSSWRAPYDEGVIVTNVGLFVKQTRKGLCIATGLDKDDKEWVLGPSYIPAAMVRKIRRLR